MQEKQVTIGDTTHPLPKPFLVLATQNPIEQEGTYPLPEAQVDRFMLKIKIGYPSQEEERRILDRMASGQPIPEVHHVATAEDILAARATVEQLFVDEKARNYIVDLVQATRAPGQAGIPELEGLIEHGASPRASIALMKASKAHAFLQGRGYVTPHDIQSVAANVLRHRVSPSYEAEAEGMSPEDIIESFGADTARWFMLSDSPPERDLPWSEAGIEGCSRFVHRLWRLFAAYDAGAEGEDKALLRKPERHEFAIRKRGEAPALPRHMSTTGG
mgnify:CR=1 FL=1